MSSARWLGALALVTGVVAAWVASEPSRLVVALVVLLAAPGYLLERVLLRGAVLPLAERVATWPAFGVSAVALLYQWAAAAGVSLAPAVLQTLAAASLVGALAAWAGTPRAARWAEREAWPWAAVLGAVLALTLWTRFAHVRELAAPPWVDSLHHALLIRAASEQGHAPYALAPYLPLERLTYHSGFHSFVAAVLAVCDAGAGKGLCGAPLRLPEAMLLVGQLLNAAVALAWGGAAAALWRRGSAVAVAALVVGLASIMPAYYVSWGRYTLVAGMLLLPAALVVAHRALTPHARWGAVAAAALVLAGLSLVHFVALCLALLWCAALAATLPASPRLIVVRGAAMGALALALTAPWYAMLVPQVRPGAGAAVMHVAGEPGYNAMPVALLWAGSNQLLVALAGLAALLGLWRRQVLAATAAVWAALVTLAANPVLIGLPYLSFFTNEFLAITLFGPLALLIAGGAALLEVRAPQSVRRLAPIAVAALAVWLAVQFQSVVRPDTVLASAADLRAIAWAAQSTPPDARFVVNTAPWLYDVDRGADGGWWLLPLAGRQVSTPPVVFNYGDPAYVRAVKEETSWLRSGAGADPAALAAFMREHGYSHVFATARGSSVDPGRLRASADFEELHGDGDVSIFRIRP